MIKYFVFVSPCTLSERDRSKGPPASKPQGKPQAKPTVKKSDDIDFGDDDSMLDGLGFDDTPRGTER